MINERRKEIIDKLLGKNIKVGHYIYTISDGLSVANLRIVVDEIELAPTLMMIWKKDGSTIGKTENSDETLEQMWTTCDEEKKIGKKI